MKTFVLNLFGAPGSGKSTFGDLLFGFLKLNGVTCEKFDEFAKAYAWEGNLTALSDQPFLLGNHFHSFFRLDGKVNLIITDSPLPLSIYYNRVSKTTFSKCFDELVLEAYNRFDNINYYMVRNFPYEQEGRYQTEAESVMVDKDLRKILKEYNIGYREIVNTTIESTKALAEKIAGRLTKFLKLYQNEKPVNWEFERKFMLKDTTPLGLARAKHIIQNYIGLGQSEKRVRQIDGKQFVFTDKTGHGKERREYETEMDRALYHNLLENYQEGMTIIKNRYTIPLKNVKTCDVDVFCLPKPMQTVEVEFESKEEMENFTPPEWFGNEIFNHSNHNLAMGK